MGQFGAGVTADNEQHVYWKLNLGPRAEQCAPLTEEPSFWSLKEAYS